jgi:effector-binding domain-containing protein
MWQALAATGLTMAGPSGALYPEEVRGEREEEVTAFLPIAQPAALAESVLGLGVTLTMLPEVTAAVMTHVGSFATIGDTYRQLGAWVATHAMSAGGAVREHYVVSVDEATGELLPDEQLRTEIIWPIAVGSVDLDR